jgi:hypothetical protein
VRTPKSISADERGQRTKDKGREKVGEGKGDEGEGRGGEGRGMKGRCAYTQNIGGRQQGKRGRSKQECERKLGCLERDYTQEVDRTQRRRSQCVHAHTFAVSSLSKIALAHAIASMTQVIVIYAVNARNIRNADARTHPVLANDRGSCVCVLDRGG